MARTVPSLDTHDLPVMTVVEPLRDALAEAGAAVLSAPPGAGKTTAVPLALLGSGWLAGRAIVMLEPRRLAARAAARRMASLLGEAVGERVGYRVRFDARVSARTRIEVVTEGVLTRRLQRDPALEGVGLVVFDEFHERSLDADLALALCLDAREGYREDLRVLVMSATLDTARTSDLLGGAPRIEASGRAFPVEVIYRERPAEPSTGVLAAAVRRALEAQAGDVLVFLPGAGEIRALAAALDEEGAADSAEEILVHPLYGDLSPQAQDRAISPDPEGRRRVVLATNIAETSLTIEGVGAVVDAGLARRPRFEPNRGVGRLATVKISRASADQRAGRAGRLGPGICFRLWTESEHAARPAFDEPEIASADLCPLALQLAAWGVTDAAELRWPDPPPPGALAQARSLLSDLGATDPQGRITATGRRMAELPVHPRLAAMLVRAGEGDRAALACDLAAVLEAPDTLSRAGRTGVDLLDRVRALWAWRADRRAERRAGVDPRACREADRASAQLARRLEVRGDPAAAVAQAPDLLLAAYPDRLAARRGAERGRFRLRSGSAVSLADTDPLGGEDFLVVPDLDAGAAGAGRAGRAYRALAVTRDVIEAELADAVERSRRVRWDPREEAVDAVEALAVGAVVLERRPIESPDPDAVLAAMLEGARQMGLAVLPWDDAARSVQARVDSLAVWRPEEGWPRMDEAALLEDLEDWLGPWLGGVRRRSHLARLDLAAALRARLPHPLARRLDEGAPTHLTVPTGSQIRLAYALGGEPPVLAVKLQEMFGLEHTPTVCWGQVPVVVHLLSPAGRPLQVTQDLGGFWRGAYAEVRKQMRGRYPRHPWPEDPLSATPTRMTKRRPGGSR